MREIATLVQRECRTPARGAGTTTQVRDRRSGARRTTEGQCPMNHKGNRRTHQARGTTEGQLPDEPQRVRCPMNHRGNRRTRQDRRRRYGLSITFEDPKVISIGMYEQVRDIRGGGDWHTPRHRDESSLGGESQVRKRRFRTVQASLTLP